MYIIDPCDDGTVRLVGGNATSGIVEICNENSWRSICDDFWTYRGARVACRLLELPWEGMIAIGSCAGVNSIGSRYK